MSAPPITVFWDYAVEKIAKLFWTFVEKIPLIGFVLRSTGLLTDESAPAEARGDKRIREDLQEGEEEEVCEVDKKCKRDLMFDAIRDFLAFVRDSKPVKSTEEKDASRNNIDENEKEELEKDAS